MKDPVGGIEEKNEGHGPRCFVNTWGVWQRIFVASKKVDKNIYLDLALDLPYILYIYLEPIHELYS